ncbi:hypothetical protein JOB18_040231 [Solea senegalensis]|uniref:Uncharacterized protein n=1 Tax=Solea senegalensis TaxID=28829 RepID=A0AAV6PCH0_SOLSE|nr:hypothetical protein JOB18_040231 [Solea senegalensis]
METKPFLSLGFLKPQCSLAPSMERGRSGEACSCFSGVCPLHQRRLSSGNSHCTYKLSYLLTQLM